MVNQTSGLGLTAVALPQRIEFQGNAILIHKPGAGVAFGRARLLPSFATSRLGRSLALPKRGDRIIGCMYESLFHKRQKGRQKNCLGCRTPGVRRYPQAIPPGVHTPRYSLSPLPEKVLTNDADWAEGGWQPITWALGNRALALEDADRRR